jgi:hypothetical protein
MIGPAAALDGIGHAGRHGAGGGKVGAGFGGDARARDRRGERVIWSVFGIAVRVKKMGRNKNPELRTRPMSRCLQWATDRDGAHHTVK